MNKLSALLFVCSLLYCKYSDNKNKYVKYGVGILSLYFLYKSFPSIDTLPPDITDTTCTAAKNCTLKDRPAGSAENYCSTDLMAQELSSTLGLAGADDGTICNHDEANRTNNLSAGQKCNLKCTDPNKKIFTKDGKIASEQNPVAVCVANTNNAAEPIMAVDEGLAEGCRKARLGEECATNDDCEKDENGNPMNCNNKKCEKQDPSDDTIDKTPLNEREKFIICKVTGNKIDDVSKWNSACGDKVSTALAGGGVCCNPDSDETPLGDTGMAVYTAVVCVLFVLLVAMCKWLAGGPPLEMEQIALFSFCCMIPAAICVYNFYRFYKYSNKYKAV